MPDGRQAIYVKDFTYESNRAPSKKEYQNIGSIAGGDSSETTDITIEFIGGN
jgi:preprotein translocase subunit SecB